MRRLPAIGVSVLTGAALVVACRQVLPSNRYLQLRRASVTRWSTADARGKFDHVRHAPQLAKGHVTCIDCHRFDHTIDTSNDALAHELSQRALYPGGSACHYCHTAADTRVAGAPSACNTCHDNLLALRPADHDVSWLKVHASMARATAAQCADCHQQSFCITCHERRDTIQTRMHDRNYRYTHGIEVRANPMQCGSCHRADFCSNCHQQGKVGVP